MSLLEERCYVKLADVTSVLERTTLAGTVTQVLVAGNVGGDTTPPFALATIRVRHICSTEIKSGIPQGDLPRPQWHSETYYQCPLHRFTNPSTASDHTVAVV